MISQAYLMNWKVVGAVWGNAAQQNMVAVSMHHADDCAGDWHGIYTIPHLWVVSPIMMNYH